MKTQSILLMVVFWVSSNSFAGEGGYLIKSTPTDVKVYIDDKLHAEQTPYTVKLSEGKHIVRIEKEGKQTITKEILISNKGIIKDEFTLVDILPPCPQDANFKDILYPKKDSFETEEEFIARIKQRIEYHNKCTELNDPRYSVGVGELHEENYNLETGEFPITVHWINEIVSWLCSTGIFKIERDDARALRVKNKEHPIFLYFDFDEKSKEATLEKILIRGENKFYEVAIIKKWHNVRCSGKDFFDQKT